MYKAPLLWSVLIFCCLSCTNLHAFNQLQLSIEQILLPETLFFEKHSSDKEIAEKNTSHLQKILKNYQLDQLMLNIDISSSPVKISADLSHLKLPEPFADLSDLKLSCQSLIIAEREIKCSQGTLSIKGLFSKEVTQSGFSLSVLYDQALQNQQLLLTLDKINVGQGSFAVKLHIKDEQWQANIKVNKLNYVSIEAYLQYYLGDELKNLHDVEAQLSFSAKLTGNPASFDTIKNQNSPMTLNTLESSGYFNKVSYSYGDDLAENLSFVYSVNIKKTVQTPPKFDIRSTIKNLTGELYQNEVYLVLTGKEKITARLKFSPEQSLIDFSSFTLSASDVFKLSSQGTINFANNVEFNRLNAQVAITDLSLFSQLYLNDILTDTDYESLEMEGAFNFSFIKNRKKLQASSEFKHFSLAFEQISMIDLQGKIHWNNHKADQLMDDDSRISWQELNLNQLPLGASTLNFNFHNDTIKLNQEVDLPLFDGALHINSLAVKHIAQLAQYRLDARSEIEDKPLSLDIDGFIKPISLEQLSSHFDWPLLDGTLSAVIPQTHYNEHSLEVGGALMLQVFDGILIIKDLKIDEPLEDYAQLSANIDFNQFNLKSLTKTYNFGEIEGRVEGKISGLELDSWQPVTFDAYIRTPIKDKSRHRISQRAIDNLSSLGGASGLLSRSFLGFFESFRYDKIGLSCRLKQNICEMQGIKGLKPKGNGYYIVKGSGIPRIDVMGFQNQVNWKVLMNRLKSIQLANEAVIE